jgi:hypothetical protein
MYGIGRAEAARFERHSRCFELHSRVLHSKRHSRCFGHKVKIPTLPSLRFGCAT